MNWYNTGTVTATNASGNLVFSGSTLLANANPGQGVLLDDGLHELLTVDDDTHATIRPVYAGTTAAGKAYQIAPLQGYLVALAAQVAAMVNSVAAYTSLAPAAGDFLQFLGGTPVPTTRTPIQAFTALANALSEVDVASGGTCNIGGAASPKVQITGTTGPITSLGTVANAIRWVRFAGALTLTHNATTLILPTGANIAAAAGDTALFASDASGNWRCLSYQRADGRMLNLASPTFTGTANVATLYGSGAVAHRKTGSVAKAYGAGGGRDGINGGFAFGSSKAMTVTLDNFYIEGIITNSDGKAAKFTTTWASSTITLSADSDTNFVTGAPGAGETRISKSTNSFVLTLTNGVSITATEYYLNFLGSLVTAITDPA